MSEGNWTFGRVYLETSAAEKWGLPPSEFRKLSEEDQAEMMAKIRVDAKRAAVDAYKREEHSVLVAAKGKRRR